MPEDTKKTTKTLYHIFREIDHAGVKSYEPVAAGIIAASASSALSQIVKETGVYVAVPARSFTPTKVSISTQTVVKVGAATA